MVKRLVYAEDVIDEIDKWLDCVGYATVGRHLSYYGELLGCIKDAPTVDAVEVVRCKDCRHWREDIDWCDINSHFVDDNDAPCSPEDSPNWRMFNANDFCSYGERKVSE